MHGKKKSLCYTPCLHCRRNLTMVSNIREAVPRSLFWAPNRLNESREVRFEFPFILIGQSIVYFFNRPIMARTQILEAPNKDFGAVSQKN